MAASSSSSKLISHEVANYDVFLSFRGEDTRYSFTSHLYAALCRNQIETFIDDEFHRGDELSPSLLKAIEESKISVIVFSEGYASSRLCLDELVKILECKKLNGQIVIPVFYNVNPSDLRNQIRAFEEKLEKVRKWRISLTEAANLSGFGTKLVRSESVLVEEIVEHILMRLNYKYPSCSKDMIGVQSSVKEIESLLSIGSKDVCIVGIWGMGGIGKTTLAKAVFDEISSQFEDYFFALNVREESESPTGLTSLRQKLLGTILKGRCSNIGFTFIKQRLGRKKVLIVFDDLTSLEQIEFLIGDINCLDLGSRIIITARDKEVLKNCGVGEDNMYKVKALFHREALELFSWYAFQQNLPTLAYRGLSNRVVKYAKGIPLALKVLGSFLLGRKKKVWENTINSLERSPHKDIQEVLKVGYDGLDNVEKNIFLDIACFLNWEDRDFVIKFLDASGFFAEIGLSVLIDKCLITLSNNKITMHDLLQQMGREIVRQESPNDPGGCSRLRYHMDIFNLLKNNMGTKAIEGICLDMSKIRDIHLDPHTFARMHNLRFLKIYNSHYEENNINKVHVSQGLESVFAELRYFCWYGFPLKSLQSTFHLENLLALDMPHSNVEQLWAGVQHLDSLKHINLSHCKHLLRIPDLSLSPNLESLNLEGCTSLFEISSSIEHLSKLVILNLRHCKSIESLPSNICKLKSLEHFNLSGCSKLHGLPDNLGSLEALKVLEAKILAIRELPSSIVYLSLLMELNLIDCCIMELPNNLGQLSSLESLLLGGNNFEKIPTSIIDLSKLFYLDLSFCERLQSLPELPCSLEAIDVHSCTSLESSLGLSILSATNWKPVNINLSNCFKLDQNGIKNIVKDALEEIQHATGFQPRASICICFPGTEISEWFYIQSRGSSISFELPSGLFNPNFVTFVMCVVVEFRNYQDEGQGLVVGYDCKLQSGKDTLLSYHGTLKGWNYDIGPHYVDSDHIFLGYDFNIHSYDSEHYDSEVNIEFYVEDLNTKRIDCCKVRKCGIYLWYCQEIRNAVKVIVEEKLPKMKLDGEKEKPPCKKMKGALL